MARFFVLYSMQKMEFSMDKNCPKCGKRGLALGIETLKALLIVSLRRLNDELQYRFCTTKDCDVVYFGNDGSIFTTEDLSLRVYQKMPSNPDVLVCYCFQYRLRDLLYGKADALRKDIQEGIKAGQCACVLRNPQGNCCLGNVEAILKSR
jgi:hypothetical protein